MFHLLRNLRKRTSHFYSVVERYGYGQVPAAEVYSAFESLATLADFSFQAARPGLYVRKCDAGFFHLLKVQALKGGSYSVWWGVSLPFVPQIQGKRLRWHRTLKSARLDLFEDPPNYFELHKRDWPSGSEYFAQNGHGAQYLAETMERMWSNLETPALEWLDSTSTTEGVLRKAEGQLSRDWHGVGHSPDPQLVHAFTLRELGRPKEATASLARYLGRPGVSPDESILLTKALEGAA